MGTVPLTVEAALSAATGSYAAWDVALWDTGTWGPDDLWTDISQYVQSVETQRRFDRDLQAWGSGTANIVLNNSDGRFCPDNMDSPYVVAGITGVRPWRKLRIKIGVFPIYTGYALAWDETYARGHATSSTLVRCEDEFSALARFDGFETEPVGSGELTGPRLHRLLDNAGHIGDRAIDEGRFSVQATTLAQPTLTEMKLTSDSEGGALWVEADGSIWFENRYALIENDRSRVIQATFGDGSSFVELPCMNIETAYDGENMRNIAVFARAGGTAQLFDDATSRALYGDARFSRSDLLLEADADVAGLSELYVRSHKDADLRIESITFRPTRRDHPIMLLHAVGRKVRDLVRVIVRPPLFNHVMTRDCHISGISHKLTKDDWTCTFELQSADAWAGFSSSLWDTAVWDTDVWFI
jgi:hypothetical protein